MDADKLAKIRRRCDDAQLNYAGICRKPSC